MAERDWRAGNLWEIPSGTQHEGELLVVPHDEVDEGERQEELYLVVSGRARFVCDGEEVELGPGELLFARPGVLTAVAVGRRPRERECLLRGQ